jgi:DNA-binding transcriptional LysR family regulator
MNFVIPPEDCLLALAFRDSTSLREAARRLHCDPATLVRKTKQAAHLHGLLQKIGGRWKLTSKGEKLVRWAEDSIAAQRMAAVEETYLRVATTMWLSERLLIPAFPELTKNFSSRAELHISTAQAGLEADLLAGRCEYVVACDIPSDPLVKFRRVLQENWIVAIPARWARDFSRGAFLPKLLASRPFVRHSGLHPEELLDLPTPVRYSPVSCDHLLGIRAAILHGHGWSFVPEILVRTELKNGTIAQLKLPVPLAGKNVTLWWLRTNALAVRHAAEVGAWLQKAGSLPG